MGFLRGVEVFREASRECLDCPVSASLCAQVADVISADLSQVVRSPWWTSWRRLAALAAFGYEPLVPVFEIWERLVEGSYDVVTVSHRSVGVDEEDNAAVQRIRLEEGRLGVRSIY